MSKILIVDDSRDTLSALSELLERAGYEVVVAGSFEQGKALADQASPDLFIVDVRLGAYNGLQLLARERVRGGVRPIIVVTGFPDPVLHAEASRLGAEFMEKPIQTADLLRTIRELLPHAEQPT